MIGAIAGDMIGSPYEVHPIKHKKFVLQVASFTDDTVLTVAVARAILDGLDYADTIKGYANRYPRAGYGGSFRRWMLSWENKPYGSFGNGSAMRVSPVGFAFEEVDEVLEQAKRSAEVSHNHCEGIKGAQAYYKEMPEEVVTHVRQSLTPDLLEVVDRFCEKFPCCVDFLAVKGAW